jgi:hypothetical protein
MCLFEVWHTEVDTAFIHFAYELVKCGSMEHDLKSSQIFSTSSPHLACDLASLFTYFWAAYGSGTPYC